MQLRLPVPLPLPSSPVKNVENPKDYFCKAARTIKKDRCDKNMGPTGRRHVPQELTVAAYTLKYSYS